MFFSTPRRRRIANTWDSGSLDQLEARALMSAANELAGCLVEPAAEISTLESVSTEAVPRGKASKPKPFSGDWTVTTDLGDVSISSVQKGNKVRGTVDLSGIDTSGIALPFNAPRGVPSITLPEINFTGKFVNGTLNLSFSTKIDFSPFGQFNVSGTVTGTVDLLSQTVSGHVSVSVNGDTLLDTDFSGSLPPLTIPAASRAVPRISVAGTYAVGGDLGSGELTITQNGLNINGVFDTPEVTNTSFIARFKNDTARVAKGNLFVTFTDDPESTFFEANFKITFLKDGGYKFSFGKLKPFSD